ncbi:MAG: radical SAM protein [Myxococcales bacterium]|nr:radical SAM protein [Myxococcales bacterium]
MTNRRRIELPIVEANGHHRVVHDYRPAYVVWELTLRCDQPCTHCGSRAGDARPSELSTAEALRVVAELAEMRAREVVLIGGEAYLHPGFLEVIAALSARGVSVITTTGGRGIDATLARAMAKAGLRRASVSIDGLEATHDLMRAARGSFASASAAIRHLADAGIVAMANTNVNRLNEQDLEPLYEHLARLGIKSWQVQLTTPLGRAADRPDMVLQPWDLLSIVPRVAALKERARKDGILVMPGNNLGYFGPEEATLRSLREGDAEHWVGCQAGKYVMGIESDGAVKGCPSLQTASYVGGTLKDPSRTTQKTLKEIWETAPELAFTRERTKDDPKTGLWGYCASCDFGEVCLGGCTFTAHAFFGRPGNNPYCHYRARVMKERGVRERIVLRESAPGTPFDHAQFDLVEEPFDAPDERPARRIDLVRLRRKPRPFAKGG